MSSLKNPDKNGKIKSLTFFFKTRMENQPTEEEYFNIDFDNFVVPFRVSGEARNDPRYFNTVYITPRSLLNMINHSLTTSNEVMGYLAGHFKGQSYIITDAVALPIEGTETRVTANDESEWKLIEHFCDMNRLGRPEDQTGWYHTHPSYFCYFSKIDIVNHRIHCEGRGGCFVGLVLDPTNTASSGSLHLSAFSTIPKEKVVEKPLSDLAFRKYRLYANHYYELDIKNFITKSDRILLKDIISKSYYQTIAESPLDINSEYIAKNEEIAGNQITKIDSPDQREDDIPQLIKIIQTINSDRKKGIMINRIKKTVFG